MVKTILFPSSYFSIRNVDEDLKAEYDAAVETGLFDNVLFSYDKWFNEDKLVLNQLIDEPCEAIYRGWMMKPEKYVNFYNQLKDRGITLVTSPREYEHFHIFPNVYPEIVSDTAQMIVFPDGNNLNVEELKKKFNRFMVKDYVKSVKGTSFPKYFDESITQQEFDEQMEKFYNYRGNLYTGGICIKEYLSLKLYGDRTNEYRVFYVNGEIATISRNSGQGSYAPLPPKDLIEKYKSLDSTYYTLDYAELDDCSWRILEAGDGQVSGLSDNQDYRSYFRTLYHCFN
ncbi:ATP-grasp domain-containing protein [Ruminococcus sp.]|uniref:ATP-grasp domain-containing protein n=1 Tax=Ruminococcus sp. TaxID=41978 RepID=UPI001B79EF12|nr:ATP-grasp domain-containing protein [Ruminococcus sp.]MBP5434020.1 ATP-grasp domain-containing protein [Ruminococcus sp.]